MSHTKWQSILGVPSDISPPIPPKHMNVNVFIVREILNENDPQCFSQGSLEKPNQ